MADVFRVREAFAVPGPDGFMRTYATGALIAGDDPVASSHGHLMEPAANKVEKATAEPGTRRSIRLPSGGSVRDATQHRTGHAHKRRGGHTPKEEVPMVHTLPPEDENSPASPFAPVQPGAGVVADDVPPEQNPAGGPAAADVTVEDVEKLTPAEPPANPEPVSSDPVVELRGQALDDALDAAGLSKSGTVEEKRARLAEHQAGNTPA